MGLGTVLDDLDGTDHATTEQRVQRIVFFPKTHHSSFCDIIDHIILPIMV